MRQHRSTYADDDELFERGVLRRLPRLAPHLIPAREHARVALSTLAVLDRETAGHDRAVALEAFTHLAEGRCRKTELRLHVLHAARPRTGEMPDEARGIVVAGFRLRERSTAERIGGACRFGRKEERLATVQLRLEYVGPLRQLAAPVPLRLRPGGEALLRRVVRLLVRRGEQAGQRRVLREREHASVLEEGVRIVERPQLPIWSEPAVEETLRAELR